MTGSSEQVSPLTLYVLREFVAAPAEPVDVQIMRVVCGRFIEVDWRVWERREDDGSTTVVLQSLSAMAAAVTAHMRECPVRKD